MTQTFTQHAIALSLAAIMTVGVLGSLNGLADNQYQAAQTVAQAAGQTSA